MLEHLFYAEADGLALFIEGGEFGFCGAGIALIRGELVAERSDFGFGGGAGFAFALDDFYGAEDLLFECLDFVGGDTWADGGCTHTSTSIDGASGDWPEGNWGGIYLDAPVRGLNVALVESAIFKGVAGFACGFLMVSLWWIDGGTW